MRKAESKEEESETMEETFGGYIREKRLAAGVGLRKFAGMLGITPSYMIDIEKGNRHPPDIEKIEKMARILELTKEETNHLFDLVGKSRKYSVAPDIIDYIMNNEIVRIALRTARDIGAGDEEWTEIIQLMKKQSHLGENYPA